MLTGCHHRHSRAVDTIVYTILTFTLFFCLPGCSSLWKARERIVVRHDTTTVHHRDSLILKDSVYIREWIRGDTVFVDKFRDRYIFRDRWRDSISVREVHDTTTVEVSVEKSLSWSQKAKISVFPWLLLVSIGLLLWTFRKYLF